MMRDAVRVREDEPSDESTLGTSLQKEWACFAMSKSAEEISGDEGSEALGLWVIERVRRMAAVAESGVVSQNISAEAGPFVPGYSGHGL